MGDQEIGRQDFRQTTEGCAIRQDGGKTDRYAEQQKKDNQDGKRLTCRYKTKAGQSYFEK